MKKLLSLPVFVLLLSAPAFGQCNYNSPTAGCPAECPGANGSFTPAPIPGSGWIQGATSTASVDCFQSINFDATHPCANAVGNRACMTVFFPHERPANLYWIFCWHGGGFSGGEVESCFGQGLTSYSPVALIQLYLDTPNPVGGKGIGIIEVDSLLATSPGVNTFPAVGWQSPKCAVWYALANRASFGGNWTIVGNYGPSAGGTTSWWIGQTSDALYPASCPTAPGRPTGGYRTVSAWPVMVFGVPVGNAFIDYTDGPGPSAMYDLLDANSTATVRTQDAALDASPNSNITQANYAFLAQPLMMQFGATDPLVEPTWNSGAGGNSVEPMAKYAGLNPPLTPVDIIYPNCAHECDLEDLPFAPSVEAAFNFLLESGPLTASRMTIEFPNQIVNTASSSEGFLVTNDSQSPVAIGGISITGTNPGDFADANNCPASPATIAANGTCVNHVTFTPSAAGARSAAIVFADNAPGGSLSVQLGGTGTAASSHPWPNGYTWQATFTVAAGQMPVPQANFPVLISGTFADFATTAHGGKVFNTCIQTVGNRATTAPCDLIFTSDAAGTARLNWEFETWLPANGTMSVWVNAPNLGNGTIVYAWYGQSSVTALQTTASETWSGSFMAVYHLQENPAGIAPQMNDSTANGNSATMNGSMLASQQQPGEIGGSVSFEGNTWASLANPANFSFERTDSFSLSGWLKTATNSGGTLLSKFPVAPGAGWALMQGAGATNPVIGFVLGGTNGFAFAWTPAIATSRWHYVVATYSGTSSVAGMRIYVDGVSQPLTTVLDDLTTSMLNNLTPAINGRAGPNSMSADSMEEIRVSAKGVVFSPAWVTASFNDQSSPGVFFSVVMGLTAP